MAPGETVSASGGWQDYVHPAKEVDWQDYQPPRDTIGVNRGPQTASPGYRYSTGYAGPNDEQRSSGGFIDRMTTAAGQSLQNPANFIPDRRSIEGLLSVLDPRTWQEYRALHERLTDPNAKTEDLAKILGDATPAVLTALVTHAADSFSNPVKAAGEPAVTGAVAPPKETPIAPRATLGPAELSEQDPAYRRHDLFLDGKKLGEVQYRVNGDTAEIQWIGSHKELHMEGEANALTQQLGTRNIISLARQIQEANPEVENFEGLRVGGARVERSGTPLTRSIRLPPKAIADNIRDPETGGITPQGWYYLGRMQEIARGIEANEAAGAGAKDITPSRAAKLTKPVVPPASTEDLSPLLQEMLKRVTAAKGKLSDLQ